MNSGSRNIYELHGGLAGDPLSRLRKLLPKANQSVAGYMLMSSPSNLGISTPFRESHPTRSVQTITVLSPNESDLSDSKDTPPIAAPSSTKYRPSNETTMCDEASAAIAADAEGYADGEYDMDITAPRQQSTDAEGSLSEGSIRPAKRKAQLEVDEYIMMDPELYGLRRSGRSRLSRRVVESSSENEDSDTDIHTGPARKRRKATVSESPSKQPTPPSQPSSTDSDSDAYGGARQRNLTKKERRRQLQVAAGLAPPSHAEVRFSTRRAARVATYNEDDDDLFSDEEAEVLTPNHLGGGVDESAPSVDAVLKHRLKEDIDPNIAEPSKQDFEYFIKWQGRAHYHSTWEAYSTLSSYRGLRRIENYFRKIVAKEIYMARNPDIPPEEKEKYNLDRERDADALIDYMQVERVIGSRGGEEGGTEYLVKWKSLYYDSCTWESSALISELAQLEIDKFLNRSSKLPVSNKAESNLQTRREYKAFREQPPYIQTGELREFQIKGVNFLAHKWCRGDNVILADEMGLGKTVQTVSFLNWLRHERGQHGPFIVVVPLSTIPSWADTFNTWTPDINYVVYNGNENARNIIREYELLADGNTKKVKFNVLLTTYEYILVDASFLSQIKWQFMAVDEAHRLKNRDSQLYAKLMDFGAPSRLLITGTPMQNTLAELAALMDFLMPGKIVVEDDIDLQSEAASQKISELTEAISPYMLRRTKQKVENDLPPKTEKIVRVELSDIQLEYYKNILTRNYAALNQGAKGQKQSLLNIMMELKKASNHPFMFPNAEERILAGSERREDILKALITSSGKMMLLDQLLTKLKRDNHRVLIFSQMVKMLDILGDYLHLRGHQFQRLDGTIAAGPRRMAIDHFNAPDSNDFCFLLSTRAGGLGINLMTADTVILFDSDWNPQADLQAMARAHRIGQKHPVTIYRLVSKDTVEEEVLERARNKLMLEFITIQRGVTDKDADKEFSDRVKRAAGEPTSSDDISRILKRRGQKMFEQSGNQKKLEELDIDAVLESAEVHKTEQPEGIAADGGEEFLKSFEYTDVKVDLEWDDIIPRAQLDELKAEEKKKEDEKYLAAVIEQNAPRKRKAPAEDREQRAAKKRARDLAAIEAADEAQDQSESGPDADPKRPLNEKEVRNLIRAHERYGSLEERKDEMIQDARLVGRDIEILKATLDDVLSISQRLLKEEQDKVEALQREANKVLTKKDRKAVLFDYKGVKRLNAETLTERPAEMRMLKEATEAFTDWRNFRIPEASKPAHYTCEWGAREDGMLCVGIAKHGYGAWVPIRDDPDLGMGDKFYLEEHRVDKKEERLQGEDKYAKSPGAVHLVRRANYLLSVIKDKMSNGTNIAAKKALENHHRNNKKNAFGQTEKSDSVSASPAPSVVRKTARIQDTSSKYRSQTDSRHSVDRRLSNGERTGTPEARREEVRKPGTDGSQDRHRSVLTNGHHVTGNQSSDQQREHQLLDKFFAPIMEGLLVLKAQKSEKGDKPSESPNERVAILRREILRCGSHIDKKVQQGKLPVSEGRLWDFIGHNYFPNKAAGAKLKDVYRKYQERDIEKANGSTKSAAKTNSVSHAKSDRFAVKSEINGRAS